MNAKQFYSEIISREETMKEIKDEIQDAIECFASSHNLTVDGVKKAIKEYKTYLKDQAKYLMTDRDAETVFNSMAE